MNQFVEIKTELEKCVKANEFQLRSEAKEEKSV